MAYLGLKKPVIAYFREENNKASYTNGIQFAKAIEVEISPEYEDTGEYSGMNDLEYEKEFLYADITLGITTILPEAEQMLFGHAINDSETRSNAKDQANYVGFGFTSQERINGVTKYVAFWVCKAKFYEESQNHETRGESIGYHTPKITGRALPTENGDWRIKKIFETEKQAIEWLKQTAGIQ